jgi:hypothetical protein
MKSCIDQKPVNPSITITNIAVGSAEFIEKPDPGCEEQYEMTFNGNVYGSTVCQDNSYFIVSGKKIRVDTAQDVTKNPHQNPGYVFSHLSSWLKIDKEHNSYLCIAGPVALSGAAAARGQYYIIEYAFEKQVTPAVFYYYFDQK